MIDHGDDLIILKEHNAAALVINAYYGMSGVALHPHWQMILFSCRNKAHGITTCCPVVGFSSDLGLLLIHCRMELHHLSY
jgi:hypothetical protein